MGTLDATGQPVLTLAPQRPWHKGRAKRTVPTVARPITDWPARALGVEAAPCLSMSLPPPPQRRQALRVLTAGALSTLSLPWLSACGGSNDRLDPNDVRVTHDGLNGRTVLRLREAANGLLAATDVGVFQRLNGVWVARQLAAERVLDLLVVPDGSAAHGQRWLASTVRTGEGSHTPRLVESRDAGVTWQTVTTDFGGSAGPEAIQALAYDATRGRLLATGVSVLAESDLNGRTWRRLAGEWQAFGQPLGALLVAPTTGDVWHGGQNAIEQLVLRRWRRATGAVNEHPNLMPAPSVVKGLRASRSQSLRVLASGEGGVVHTLDDGKSWQRLIEDGHHFYFEVAQDPLDAKRWVTARWVKTGDPQPLLLLRSDDDGLSWKSTRFGDANFYGGAWSTMATTEGGKSVYYLGLDKGGVARVQFSE